MNIKSDDVEWIFNDLGELGVKIGDRFFFLYKGASIDYQDKAIGDLTHGDDCGAISGQRMKYRHVYKREFGECCHPLEAIKHYCGDGFPENFMTAYGDIDDWKEIPNIREGSIKS